MSIRTKEEVQKWIALFKELGIDLEAGEKLLERVEFVKPETQRTDPIILAQKVNEMRDILDEIEVGQVFGDGSLKALEEAVGLEATRSDHILIRRELKEDGRLTFKPRQPEQLVKALPRSSPPIDTEKKEDATPSE